MSDAIPFFSAIPTMAIPAVQRLFDDAQAPGYSLPAVYSNLVSRLNACGVTPPARALVKRWLAGVTAGMIDRPAMPDGIDDAAPAPAASYFESLPDAATPALTAVWDAIQAAVGTADEADAEETAFDVFFEAMREIGHREPEWRPFVAYARAVRLGQVERPARQIVEELPSAALPVEEAAPQDVAEPTRKRRSRQVKVDAPAMNPAAEVEDAAAFVPLTPENFRSLTQTQGGVMASLPPAAAIEFLGETEAEADIAERLRLVRDDLIASAYAALQASMRRRAAQIVAGQLRAMADEMELGGA